MNTENTPFSNISMMEFACPAADLSHRASRYGPRQGHQKAPMGQSDPSSGKAMLHKLLRPSRCLRQGRWP